MARTGIYLCLKALIQPGQEVILSPYTIADVVNMVICAGGRPVFADLAPGTCNVDPEKVAAAITPRTGCVLVTHFYGLMCDMDRLRAICDRHGLPLLEDAAQAFGARLGGRPAGTLGTAGVFSFGLYKPVNSFLGGAVVTRDAGLRDRLAAEMAGMSVQPRGPWLAKLGEALRIDLVTQPTLFGAAFFWLFRHAFLNGIDAINNRLKIDLDPKLKVSVPPSYLHRLSATQAALILAQLDGVEAALQERIAAARLYHAGLRDVAGLTLPPLRDDGSHAYWYFTPIAENDGPRGRHALVGHAMRMGRDIAESYHRNCADLPCFAAWAGDCPEARRTAAGVIYLPTYPGLPVGQVEANVAMIRDFFGADL